MEMIVEGEDRIQGIAFDDGMMQITYVPESKIDKESGIFDVVMVQIPYDAIHEGTFAELVDAVERVLSEAREVRRAPVKSFTAPR